VPERRHGRGIKRLGVLLSLGAQKYTLVQVWKSSENLTAVKHAMAARAGQQKIEQRVAAPSDRSAFKMVNLKAPASIALGPVADGTPIKLRAPLF